MVRSASALDWEKVRETLADSEAICVEYGMLVTVLHCSEMDLNAIWICGGEVVEIPMKAIEVMRGEDGPFMDFVEAMKKGCMM